MRNLAILLILLLLPSYCLAESEEDLRAYDLQQENLRKEAVRSIPQVIEKYATTLGCNFYMNPNNEVPYQIEGETVYVALFSLDFGCGGGSGMAKTSLVVLSWSESYPKLYISPQRSKLIGEFPPIIDKLFIKNDQLWYSALWLQPQDPLCCPSGPGDWPAGI